MRTYRYRSESNPSAEPYTAVVHDDGRVTCDCRGFRTPKGCWHLRDAAAKPIGRTDFPPITTAQARKIREGLKIDDETAIESALEAFPSMSRDEAVDLIGFLGRVCRCGASGFAPAIGFRYADQDGPDTPHHDAIGHKMEPYVGCEHCVDIREDEQYAQ